MKKRPQGFLCVMVKNCFSGRILHVCFWKLKSSLLQQELALPNQHWHSSCSGFIVQLNIF